MYFWRSGLIILLIILLQPNLEKKLDLVSDGKEKWRDVVSDVYKLMINNEIYKKPGKSIPSQKRKDRKSSGIEPCYRKYYLLLYIWDNMGYILKKHRMIKALSRMFL